MSAVPPPRHVLTIRTSRETLVLLAAAGAMVLAIGHTSHLRPVASAASGVEQTGAGQTAAGQWAGQLADLAPSAPPAAELAPAAPLSSEALTVPKAALALPVPPKPAAPAAGAAAPPRMPAPAKVAATPPRRPPAKPAPPIEQAGLMQRLNPLNHLPDMVKRPFASAGDAVAGWVKWF